MDALNELFLMQQAIGTLFSVTNKLQAVGDQYLKDMTVRQVMLMVAIIHLPEDQTTLNNIARKLGTTKQSVKHLVEVMEKKGYVTMVPSEKDKRAVNIQITQKGREVFLGCSKSSLEYFLDVFHEFSAKELQFLWDLLKKLYRFDGKKQDGFEENVNYGSENGFSNSQLQEIQKFADRRARDTNAENIKKSERQDHDE